MDNQHTLQGLLDSRIERLNNFRRTMADIQLALNPLAVEGTIIFNSRTLDTYNEAVLAEEDRIDKRMVLSKVSGMSYVQDRALQDYLVENGEGAYLLRLTTTDLTRIIGIDDQVIVAGITYTMSKVRPYSRFNDSVLTAVVYAVDNVPAEVDAPEVDDEDSDLFETET